MYLGNVRVTVPAVTNAISLSEMKRHLKVSMDVTDDDELITSLIYSAESWCEKFQSRTYVTRTLKLTLDGFPDSDSLLLPMTPLQLVNNITYIDSVGDTQTWSSDNYIVDIEHSPGRVRLAYGKSWPSIRGDLNGVAVTYITGNLTMLTVNVTTNIFTSYGRNFNTGDTVQLNHSGGSLPGGFSVNTTYYVIDASESTFKLAASSGGEAIDVTSSGSGTLFIGMLPFEIKAAIKLLVGHLYEHREAVSELRVQELPIGIKDLLAMSMRNFF